MAYIERFKGARTESERLTGTESSLSMIIVLSDKPICRNDFYSADGFRACWIAVRAFR